MTNESNREAQKRNAEEWEAVFADSDPTRVLSPYSREPEVPEGISEHPQTTAVSAVRHRQEPTSSAPAAEVPLAEDFQRTSPRTLPPAFDSEDGAAPVARATGGGISPYHRVQFIPAFLGALIAHGVMSALVQIADPVLGIFGGRSYDSPTLAAVALFSPETRSEALPWSIFLAVGYLLAFAAAGYAAARMSGIAPAKQAVGVLLMTLLGMLLGSLLTWATSGTGSTLEPQFAGHLFLVQHPAAGALTLLVVLTFALVASLLGALVGSSYHRKLAAS